MKLCVRWKQKLRAKTFSISHLNKVNKHHKKVLYTTTFLTQFHKDNTGRPVPECGSGVKRYEHFFPLSDFAPHSLSELLEQARIIAERSWWPLSAKRGDMLREKRNFLRLSLLLVGDNFHSHSHISGTDYKTFRTRVTVNCLLWQVWFGQREGSSFNLCRDIIWT